MRVEAVVACAVVCTVDPFVISSNVMGSVCRIPVKRLLPFSTHTDTMVQT